MTKLLDVYFDGWRLTDYMTINSVLPRTAPRDEGLVVEVVGTIKDDVMKSFDMLAKILYTAEPKELIVSDFPNRALTCRLDGNIEVDSRFRMGQTTLTFRSEERYWHSVKEELTTVRSSGGFFHVNNEGTAPAIPHFYLDVHGEADYINVVSPNGYIALGSAVDQSRQYSTRSRQVMAEDLTNGSTSKWLQNFKANEIFDRSRIVVHAGTGDDKPIYSNNPGSFNQYGFQLKEPTQLINSTGKYVNGAAYTFPTAQMPVNANYRLSSRIRFQDFSSVQDEGVMFVGLLDSNDTVIAGVEIYDVSGGHNQVELFFTTYDASVNGEIWTAAKHYSIKSGGLYGEFSLLKEGDTFKFEFDNSLAARTVQPQELTVTQKVPLGFPIGGTVYIKKTAVHYYTGAGSAVSIPSFVRGRPYTIRETRNTSRGNEYLLTYGGTIIAWAREQDLSGEMNYATTHVITPQSGQVTNSAYDRFQYTLRSPRAAALTPEKAFIYTGVTETAPVYTNAGIMSVNLRQLDSGTSFSNAKDSFHTGDRVEINNETGEVKLNGSLFQGLIDYDSRAFTLDYGYSDIEINSPTSVTGTLQYKERWY